MGADRRGDPRTDEGRTPRRASASDGAEPLDWTYRYVSHTLLNELAAHPDRTIPWLIRVEGTMVLVDVSGFTSLSERLATAGREGAEQLTDIINAFFSGLLEIAGRFGGDALTFGGDAVLLLYSGNDHAARAAASALMMQQSLEHLAPRRIGNRRIELGMSIGAHSGEFVLAALGNESRAHLLTIGADAQRTAVVESAADAGTLVITDATRRLLGDNVRVERAAPGLWRLSSLAEKNVVAAAATGLREQPFPDPLVLIPYLPPPLADATRSGTIVPSFDGEHRKVSVVFVNVTEVERLLDDARDSVVLEELQTYLVGTFNLLERHGGTLVSSDISPDGFKLVIAFGAPIAREHDAESAARFALELRDLVAERGLSLQHQIGLHRASVYAGGVGSVERQQYTVMGDGVNLAARLMAHALPGRVIVSRELASMLDDRFRTDDLGTIQVKGRGESIDICELAEEAWSKDAIGAAGSGLPLVGRERELARISEAIERAQVDGGRVVLVVGKPGIGKSRLMNEGVELARVRGWRVLQAACYAHMSTTPYGPWLPLLEQLLGVDEVEGSGASTQTLLAYLDELAPDMNEQAPLLGPLLGLELPDSPLTLALDPTDRRRSLFRVIATLVERSAAREPIAIAIEDLHWADESSLELLEVMTSTARNAAPVLLLVSTRPASASGLRLPPERTARIELSALPQSDATKLVETATGMSSIPQALSDFLYEKTAGNPLFLEEVARALWHSGVLEQLGSASPVAAAETISQLDFPDRVQTLLMARIDELDPSARETLRHAAVIGQVFDVDALTALEPVPGTRLANVAAEVGRLERLGLLASSPGDGERYRFRHALVQEVAYGSMRFDLRRELHHRVAEHLEARLGAGAGARLDEVTHHFRRSGDRPKTFRYAIRSAVYARSLYATREAIDYYRMALESEASRSADAAGVRCVLLEQVGDSFQFTGCHRDAIRTYHDALQRWKRIENRNPSLNALSGLLPDIAQAGEMHASLCHKIAACYERESRRYDRADRWVGEALANLPDTPSSLPARVYSTQGIVRMRQGKHYAAIRSCERAAAHARDVNDDSEVAWALNTLSSCNATLGHLETALTLQQRAVTILREIGDLRRLSAAYGNLANCYMHMGDMEQALTHNREALVIETRIGATDGAAATNANIGEIEVMLGRYEAAIAPLETALDTSRAAGSDGMSGFVLMNLSRAHTGMGDLPRARASIDEAVDLLARSGMPGTLAEALIQQADVTRLEGRPRDALSLCAHALRDASRIGDRITRIAGLRVKGEALAALGRRTEAVRVLDESISLAREIGASSELALCIAARGALETGALAPSG